jgi:hypothetical protein
MGIDIIDDIMRPYQLTYAEAQMVWQMAMDEFFSVTGGDIFDAVENAHYRLGFADTDEVVDA